MSSTFDYEDLRQYVLKEADKIIHRSKIDENLLPTQFHKDALIEILFRITESIPKLTDEQVSIIKREIIKKICDELESQVVKVDYQREIANTVLYNTGHQARLKSEWALTKAKVKYFLQGLIGLRKKV